MLQLKRRFKVFGLFILLVFLATGVCAETASTKTSYSKRQAGLYRDVSDQNIYYEGIQYLRLDRFYRLLGREKRALDINVFDEVPDSNFFINRHGRSRMSLEELKKGPGVTDGPDTSGLWTITKGKFDGITPGFFIEDAKGDKYLLKFDPVDSLELGTGAEAIASRFLYAMGYNIPQYTIVEFNKDQLAISEGAKVFDETGFRVHLTPEKLDQFLLFVPQTKDGSYRASASRIIKGEILGPMKFQGRREKDPQDPINHEDRRVIRALQVFNAWINNNDVRESNSLDVVQEKDGKEEIVHYLIDFNSSLGATPRGAKSPQFGHEHMLDYGETAKAVLTLGLRDKPWQKRWDEANREVASPAVGYFDNSHFDPGKFKTQLPYYAFKDLTRADAFWAAKIIMSFTNEEIQEIVSQGKFSDPKTAEEIVKILIQRRDLMGRYWFSQANPFDHFELAPSGDSYELHFDNLAVKYGFVDAGKSLYRFEVFAPKGKKEKRIAKEETTEPVFKINSHLFSEHPSLDVAIRTRRPEAKEWSPFVRVRIRNDAGGPQIAGIAHED